MHEPIKSDVNDFLDKAKREREIRRLENLKKKSAIIIQKWYRGYRCRKNIRKDILDEFKQLVDANAAIETKHLLRGIKCLKFKFNHNKNKKDFELLCRQLLLSLDSSSTSTSYISLFLKKDTIPDCIKTTNWILKTGIELLNLIDPSIQQDAKIMNIILTVIINILTVSRWKLITNMKNEMLQNQMSKITDTLYTRLLKEDLFPKLKILLLRGVCKQKICFSQISLNGIMSIILRLFNNSSSISTPDQYLIDFIVHILSVPAIIKHMNIIANEIFQTIVKDRLCTRIILLLNSNYKNQEMIFKTLQPSYSLCIIANVIDLGLLEMDVLANHGSEFCTVLSSLLVRLNQAIHETVSSASHYHHIFGWSGVYMDENIQVSIGYLRSQLKLLWSSRMIRSMFDELYDQPLLDRSSAQLLSSGQLAPSSQYTNKSNTHENSNSIGQSKSSKKTIGGPLFKLPRLANSVSFWKKINFPSHLVNGKFAGNASSTNSIGQIPISIQSVCMLYFFTTSCLSQIRDDVLAGVSLTDLPARMWRLIKSSGSVRQWAMVVKETESGWYSQPHPSHLLHIFVLIAKNLFIILDDVEVFEKEKVFTIQELLEMCDFFNKLFVDVVQLIGNKEEMVQLMQCRDWALLFAPPTSNSIGQSPMIIANDNRRTLELATLFASCHKLLLVLYDRDIRRPFTPDNFWLIKSIKPSNFLSDLSKDKFVPHFLLRHVPHIIPYKERIVLFRDRVKTEKTNLGLVSRSWNQDDSAIGAVISVRRARIVEDGFEQLMKVNQENWKRKIRVRFINELGMNEVGIDLDGVFKEFLEESCRRLLDPTLGLISETSEHRLYPNPLSGTICGERQHLLLFQYLGLLLGKAMFEGFLVDAPFAHFFLSQLLGRNSNQGQQGGSGGGGTLYSFLDELATFDKELYQSLTYVKHYDGDISDLELTFSYDEDRLGQVETHDLRPGGRYMTVTNDTRISYVHTVARFRMFVQIRDQTRAFIHGFYSLIQRDWLNLFSVPELLKLMCGDTGNIDVDDLKSNVKYSGGFHSGHRVIVWLWDILKKDFTEKERGLFLKFVTSCSKPPILGFSNLNPPFSIRCVHSSDTADEQDNRPITINTGSSATTTTNHNRETVGSLLRNIFSLPGTGNSGGSHSGHVSVARLPSAATCFNLLKLPNYDSKSILRDKLKYVINSASGFELS